MDPDKRNQAKVNHRNKVAIHRNETHKLKAQREPANATKSVNISIEAINDILIANLCASRCSPGVKNKDKERERERFMKSREKLRRHINVLKNDSEASRNDPKEFHAAQNINENTVKAETCFENQLQPISSENWIANIVPPKVIEYDHKTRIHPWIWCPVIQIEYNHSKIGLSLHEHPPPKDTRESSSIKIKPTLVIQPRIKQEPKEKVLECNDQNRNASQLCCENKMNIPPHLKNEGQEDYKLKPEPISSIQNCDCQNGCECDRFAILKNVEKEPDDQKGYENFDEKCTIKEQLAHGFPPNMEKILDFGMQTKTNDGHVLSEYCFNEVVNPIAKLSCYGYETYGQCNEENDQSLKFPTPKALKTEETSESYKNTNDGLKAIMNNYSYDDDSDSENETNTPSDLNAFDTSFHQLSPAIFASQKMFHDIDGYRVMGQNLIQLPNYSNERDMRGHSVDLGLGASLNFDDPRILELMRQNPTVFGQVKKEIVEDIED